MRNHPQQKNMQQDVGSNSGCALGIPWLFPGWSSPKTTLGMVTSNQNQLCLNASYMRSFVSKKNAD